MLWLLNRVQKRRRKRDLRWKEKEVWRSRGKQVVSDPRSTAHAPIAAPLGWLLANLERPSKDYLIPQQLKTVLSTLREKNLPLNSKFKIF